MSRVSIELLENGFMPVKSSPFAAGFDLQSPIAGTIAPSHRLLVPLGIKIAMSLNGNVYGRIAPRSGHATRSGLDVLAGVIDADYRGEVCVLLVNTDPTTPFCFARGDKIAQLIFEKHDADAIIVREASLDDTERGDKGFGKMGGQ